MSLQPLPEFQSFATHHCVTGSLRHVYEYHGYPISEEMLLGLGEGVGSIYWHMKGAPPFYGGRANVRSPSTEGLPVTAGRRTGVRVEWHSTSSARIAEQSLLALLAAGEPVMVHLDMGFLPYMDDLPEDFHFGYHVVIVAGVDPAMGRALLPDRDGKLHPVSLADLARARGSKYKPFPPKHQYYTFDFADKHAPTPAGMQAAIRDTAQRMLEPPISNIGVPGIRKAVARTRQWPQEMDAEALRWTCFNIFFYIDASGGTGGGIFRIMYGRFLEEVAEATGEAFWRRIGQEMCGIGDQWQEVAHHFRQAAESDDPAALLDHATAPMLVIAKREQVVWQELWRRAESG